MREIVLAYRDVVGANGSSILRAREYEQRIIRLVNELTMFAVGTALLNRLTERTYPSDAGILIVPNTSKDSGADDLHGMRAIHTANAYAKSSTLPGARSSTGPSPRGTGRGTSARIYFDPGVPAASGYIGGSREILFHELVHALRALSGTMVYRPMPNYDVFEEFVAVTLSNMLLSEQGHPLRDGHDCQVMGRTLDQFSRDYDRFLKQMKADTQNGAFFKQRRDFRLTGSVWVNSPWGGSSHTASASWRWPIARSSSAASRAPSTERERGC